MNAPDTSLMPAPVPADPATAFLLSLATNEKLNVENLKELLAMKREADRERARLDFFEAMAAFRAEMPAITKCVPGQHGTTHAGTRTKGMYAPLDAITPVLDPIAARHGLSYRFDRETKDSKDWMLCIISHRGGHEVASRYPLTVDKGPGRSDIQAVASGETYAKRYALLAAFAITTADPDDDAEAAGRAESAATPAGDEGIAFLANLLEGAPDPAGEQTRLLGYFSRKAGRPITKLDDLYADECERAARMVSEKRERGWKS